MYWIPFCLYYKHPTRPGIQIPLANWKSFAQLMHPLLFFYKHPGDLMSEHTFVSGFKNKPTLHLLHSPFMSYYRQQVELEDWKTQSPLFFT